MTEIVLTDEQTKQVEWERTGGFDAAHMKQFLDQLEQADPARYGPKRAS